MKIETTKEFQPIHITLEDEDELMFMWHRMNISSIFVEKNTSSKQTFNDEIDGKLSQSLFDYLHQYAKKYILDGY